jgi:DNA-directed RNA polymerase subunit RPC12/RpoP
MSEYKCAYCGRELESLDEICECGNALGVLD